MSLDAAAVAQLLVEIGRRLILAGENPYKARAYSRAAQGLMALTLPLEEVIAAGRLREVPGIGQAIAETVKKLHAHGTTTQLEAMRSEAPAGVLEMLQVRGLTPEKVLQLYRKLGVTSLSDLEEACRDGRLQAAKGFGASLQNKVLSGIELMRRSQGQRLIHQAAEILAGTAANLERSHPELKRVVPAGECRRGCELIADLALMAESPAREATRVVELNREVRLWLASRSRYGAALVFATGSAAHVRALQAVAEERGFRLEQTGLYRGKRLVRCVEEEDVYAALGLAYVAPELREGRGEVELAGARGLPALVTDSDLRGLLHCHTDFSDGGNTLAEMAAATRASGYAYFGVADHSQSAAYAGGLKLAEIEAQHEEIDALNARYRGKYRILKGIESDIREDGSLDYPGEVLERFDFVVASVHGRFRLDREAQTERMLRAVGNPFTTILGHITGRLLLRRPGYDLDVEKVLAACARHGVAVEINANPYRLELDWRWHRRALELGCMLSINPDAHSIQEVALTRWGVLIARKGGVPKERVLNCLSLVEIGRWLDRRRALRLGAARGPKSSAR
jgi:DNA polymerase (family 10)